MHRLYLRTLASTLVFALTLVLNQSDPRATKGHAHVFQWKLLWLI